MALERWEVKALCMFGLFGSMVIFVLLPIKVSKAVERLGKRGLFILSVLSCFGGGVFFGAYLTHLSPDVRASLSASLLVPNGIVYPLPELFAGGGFFLILFLEKFILWLRVRGDKKIKKRKGNIGQNEEELGQIAHNPYNASIKLTGASFTNTAYSDPHLHHNAVGRFFDAEESISRSNTLEKLKKKEEEKQIEANALQNENTPQQNGVKSGKPRITQGLENLETPGSGCKEAVVPVSTKMGQIEEDDEDVEYGKARSIIFVVALSLDCIFEGLTLGLMSNTLDVINLFVAIISHEFIMSFCIGLELVKYNPTKIVVPAGIVYAFTPVFGAIIGTAIYESADTMDNQNTIDVVSGILQAVSAGTFIYCSFIGILSEELTHDTGFYKALSTFLGFALMAGMAAIPIDAFGSEEDVIASTVAMTTL